MYEEYELIEWNLHKMTNEINVQEYVHNRILDEKKYDIIVLVEYKKDSKLEQLLGIDYFISSNESVNGSNEILIAIKKSRVKENTIPKSSDELLIKSGQYMPDFLHVSFTDINENEISVVGVRFVSPAPSGDPMLLGGAKRESDPLNKYLSSINHNLICCGDFNILDFKMKDYFPDYYREVIKGKGLDNASIIFTNKKSYEISDFGKVDHILCKKKEEIVEASYSWDFLEDDLVYPKRENINIGELWKIPIAYPDHAILNAKIRFM